jgi:hypothetical protein
MVFENGVKNIQAAAYNGARTVVVNGLFLPILNPGKLEKSKSDHYY